jgi:hypothetical protein
MIESIRCWQSYIPQDKTDIRIRHSISLPEFPQTTLSFLHRFKMMILKKFHVIDMMRLCQEALLVIFAVQKTFCILYRFIFACNAT